MASCYVISSSDYARGWLLDLSGSFCLFSIRVDSILSMCVCCWLEIGMCVGSIRGLRKPAEKAGLAYCESLNFNFDDFQRWISRLVYR